MRRVDLELLVQQAVERCQAGRPVEDDRIEFKSEWPGSDRARQLAGAANALRGEPLIYVVGVHTDGTLQPLDETDPADWYAGMRKGFDSDPPRLAMHLNVAVGDAPGESVAALMFETDEFPYVTKVAGVTDRREVPIRVATGTASANRRQLMRILAPTITAPRCDITHFSLRSTTQTYAATEVTPLTEARAERTEVSLYGQVKVFVEYTGTHAVSIPARSVRASVIFDGQELPLKVRVHELRSMSSDPRPDPLPPAFGVHARYGYIVATGPGEFAFEVRFSEVTTNNPDAVRTLTSLLREANHADLRIKFQFVGVDSDTSLPVLAERTKDASPVEGVEDLPFHSLGEWSAKPGG